MLLTEIFAGHVIVGGSTSPIVTVAVVGVPWQLLAVGVIVNVTVRGALVVLVSEPLIVPVPLAAIPVAFVVLSRVQL